jgi:hypothetical protein
LKGREINALRNDFLRASDSVQSGVDARFCESEDRPTPLSATVVLANGGTISSQMLEPVAKCKKTGAWPTTR